jgi:hypothetical protein
VNDEGTYSYEKTATRAVGHLRRYPRHYGALALWLVAMVLLPTIRAGGSATAALPASSSGAPATGAAAVSGTGGATAAEIDRTLAGVASAVGLAAPRPMSGSTSTAGRPASSAGGSPSTPTPAGPADDGGGAEGGGTVPESPVPVPATPELVTIPPPPPVPVPAVPEELQPLLAAVAPLTTQGCSAIGLAAVVTAVVGPTAGDAVPFAQLLPYLTPAYSACATFPAPEGDRTICSVDEQLRDAGYPADVSGLAKTPNLIGLGVDVIAGFERAVASATGQELGLAAALAEALGCHPDAG